jgi:hypothetical protein
MRTVRPILSIALAASALVGIQILSTDYWLWSAAPTHAYGLVAFVALDALLILGTWRGARLAVFGALFTATVQLVAMLGDILSGQPTGTPVASFRNYLLADTAYLDLLIIQGLILAIAIGTWALPHVHGHWLASLKTAKKRV